MAKPLLTLHGVVEESPDKVAPLILGEVAAAGQGSHVEVDEAQRSVSVRGDWWYGAETTVDPHERGSLVTHRIFDVSDRARWAVRFVARTPLHDAPAAFAATIDKAGKRLGCAAYLVDGRP